MCETSTWDWDIGKRLVADTNEWKSRFAYIEEPYVSPDGEKLAAIIRTEASEFSVCENGAVWENSFDKAWYLRFAPDGRSTAMVSDTGAWTVAVDGTPWENTFDF